MAEEPATSLASAPGVGDACLLPAARTSEAAARITASVPLVAPAAAGSSSSTPPSNGLPAAPAVRRSGRKTKPKCRDFDAYDRPGIERRGKKAAAQRDGLICPVCLGVGRRSESQLCPVCYSGIYNDVKQIVLKYKSGVQFKQVLQLFDNAEIDLNMLDALVRELPSKCRNRFRCSATSYAATLPVEDRCKRCRTLATIGSAPAVSWKILKNLIAKEYPEALRPPKTKTPKPVTEDKKPKIRGQPRQPQKRKQRPRQQPLPPLQLPPQLPPLLAGLQPPPAHHPVCTTMQALPVAIHHHPHVLPMHGLAHQQPPPVIQAILPPSSWPQATNFPQLAYDATSHGALAPYPGPFALGAPRPHAHPTLFLDQVLASSQAHTDTTAVRPAAIPTPAINGLSTSR